MLQKIFALFVFLSIIASLCGEPNLPPANKICPTCRKYQGSIEMIDIENNFNWVVYYEGNPDYSVFYRSFKSTPGIRAFYHIKDPMKPVPEPLTDVDLCSMHSLSNGLESFYQLTTILASFILPVGLPCKEATGKRPIPAKVSKTSYYINREPTPCNEFNITLELATLESKLNPYMILTFRVTKPGKKCDTSPPKIPTTINAPEPTEPTKPKAPKDTEPPEAKVG
ncbi:uncharacterized protein LOC122508102 [Leptopilina heterotoma]|uniref:uncharacterized protein LOC122508102 n=1 Tax=Leptopilina heterotoma TaxID=63436 RepID=UPI001CA9BDA3|nr:uncharacterized protein LOC122508102 [Leptopilina heterotoma]